MADYSESYRKANEFIVGDLETTQETAECVLEAMSQLGSDFLLSGQILFDEEFNYHYGRIINYLSPRAPVSDIVCRRFVRDMLSYRNGKDMSAHTAAMYSRLSSLYVDKERFPDWDRAGSILDEGIRANLKLFDL